MELSKHLQNTASAAKRAATTPPALIHGVIMEAKGKTPPSRNPSPMTTEWTRDETAENETWYRDRHLRNYGYVAAYTNQTGWNWQAIRGEFRVSGIENTLDEAINKADAGLAMPQDEFNAIVTRDLVEDLREKERQLLKLNPTTSILTGYHAGFEDGFRKAREAMIAATEVAA